MGFDLETFNRVTAQSGGTTFENIGMSFGIPGCLVGLGQAALSLLPGSMLGEITRKVNDAKSKANEVTSEVMNALMFDTGIIEFDTETGTFKFLSDTSEGKKEADENSLMDDIDAFMSFAQYGVDFATQIYTNIVVAAEQVQALLDCFGKLGSTKKFSVSNSARQRARLSPEEQQAIFEAEYGAQVVALQSALEFIADCDTTLQNVGIVMKQREEDPSLEPCFPDTAAANEFLEGSRLPQCTPQDPTLEVEDEEEIFRLTYGPPLTSDGQYVLTDDGLYYDSRSGGLDPVYLAISGTVPVGDRWKYEYDANLGGKGSAVSIESLNKFADNIFDPSRIDDSIGMEEYYSKDHFLAVIQQQRDKFMYDLSSDLVRYIEEYTQDSSIVKNQKQLISAEITNHNSKINRRKKQIEVAVKAPQIYGGMEYPIFAPGSIPINDFSYLEEYNLEIDLEKQKALVFDQGEVEGIILPLETKFVRSSERPKSITYEHLHVPNVGKGSIIYTPEDPSGTVLSLTDNITTDGLFAIYNFLSTDVESPSSTNYRVTNCATEDMYNNAQLIASNKSATFSKGLAIPYFEGLVKKSSGDINSVSAIGSAVRLPDTNEFRDLCYNPSGFSFEFWVHVPNIFDAELGWLSGTEEGWNASSLTKCVLACENTGSKEGSLPRDRFGEISDLDYLANDQGDQFTRGMICGFTRDRRLSGSGVFGYSNSNVNQIPARGVSFFIAPTQSRDSSSLSWVNKDECANSPDFYKMEVDIDENKLFLVGSQFMHINISVDPSEDKIDMFVDGDLLTTSSVSNVFGVLPGTPPSVPSFIHENSFEYSDGTVDGVAQAKAGPKLNEFFTPWIIGGGYTDGQYLEGFMGGDRGGYVSGLRGHLGSIKFYSRPLTTEEVLNNYEAQQGFFKNIVI